MELIDERQLAEMLKLTRKTVQSWRLKGVGPPYIKLFGSRVRYDVDAVKTWLAAQSRAGRGS